MSLSSLNIIIIGGSLGGLNTALFLRELGCTVTIYERSATPLLGLGAGIVLNPATVRYFQQNGSLDLSALSVGSLWLRYLDASGSVADEQPRFYRFGSYNALYRAALDAFGTSAYHLGAALTALEQDNVGVTVSLSNGRRLRCDLLVCADGIRSTGRRLLLGDGEMRYAGYVAWRGIVNRQQIAEHDWLLFGDAITYRIMPNSHFLTYPIPIVDQNGRVQAQPSLNWLWYRNVQEGESLRQLLTDQQGATREVSLAPGVVREENILALQTDARYLLPPNLTALVRATPHPFLQVVMDYESPRMALGRVCLIGDAAFVARPHAAAGTAKAVEDGWQLARALAHSQGDVATALADWEARQLALGRAVVARTRAAGNRAQFDNQWQLGEPLPFGLYEIGDSEM